MKTFKLLFLLTIFSSAFFNNTYAQSALKPGFIGEEYRELISLTSRHLDSNIILEYSKKLLPYPKAKRVYRSEVVALENKWDFWVKKPGIGIISLRGTTPSKNSWLENFYAAMIPAIGEITINNGHKFKYKLATDSSAYIHAGWLLGMASMADDIVKHINEAYNQGIKDFIIIGHSQGGALALLLRSYLEYLPEGLPRGIRIKTYASAAPKVGNLKYAYDFDFITKGGWAFRVINSEDWVPQMPFSVQQVADLNKINPFSDVKEITKTMPFGARTYVRSSYNKMVRRAGKTQKTYTKYLGSQAYKMCKEVMPELEKPEFKNSFDYVACGTPIILMPTNSYYSYYVKNAKQSVFIHHMYYAYYYLCLQNYPEKESSFKASHINP